METLDLQEYLSELSRQSLLTALLEVPSLRRSVGGRRLAAGRPALRPGGQSAEEERAGPQVTPVVSPLRPLPALPGAHLHLTPRLPPQVQLQQGPLLRPGPAVVGVWMGHVFGVFVLYNKLPVCDAAVSMATGNQKKNQRSFIFGKMSHSFESSDTHRTTRVSIQTFELQDTINFHFPPLCQL